MKFTKNKKVIDNPLNIMSNPNTFVRQVNVSKNIGKVSIKYGGGHTTKVITDLTDVKGNFVNVFPGNLDGGAYLP